MKLSTWDILAILAVLGICVLGGVFLQILVEPHSAINPFPPHDMPQQVVLPSPTPTLKELPATWTVTPSAVQEKVANATQAPLETATVYEVPTQQDPLAVVTTTFEPVPPENPKEFDCVMEAMAPANAMTFDRNAHFEARWTIKNVGVRPLDSDNLDFRYVMGEKMQGDKNVYDLPATVLRWQTVDLVVPMVAPANPGLYTATWAVGAGKASVCTWTFSIMVR
jgi:hypothetical protein